MAATLAPGVREPSLYLLEMSSRKVQRVPGSNNFEGPQWSPDGKYAAASSKKDHELMLFDFGHQQWSKLADGPPYGWAIRWSADARYVYYQHLYASEEQPIFRVRISDHKVEEVASSRQILRADVLSYSMTGLTPDGSPLASLIHRNSDIYALRDGYSLRQIEARNLWPSSVLCNSADSPNGSLSRK